MSLILSHEELMKLLDEAVEEKGEKRAERVFSRLNYHAPTYDVFKYSDFVRPEIGSVRKNLPYIDMNQPVTVEPMTADISDKPEYSFFRQYRSEDKSKIYVDDKVWRICAGNKVFYVVIFEMDDPSGGLFGVMGSWIPFHIVLYNDEKEPLSEHAERNGDHIRITDCNTTESMIRYLTVWNMVDSSYRREISAINDELRREYKILMEANQRIISLYCRREAVSERSKVLIYNLCDESYEEFLKRNEDLL